MHISRHLDPASLHTLQNGTRICQWWVRQTLGLQKPSGWAAFWNSLVPRPASEQFPVGAKLSVKTCPSAARIKLTACCCPLLVLSSSISPQILQPLCLVPRQPEGLLPCPPGSYTGQSSCLEAPQMFTALIPSPLSFPLYVTFSAKPTLATFLKIPAQPCPLW